MRPIRGSDSYSQATQPLATGSPTRVLTRTIREDAYSQPPEYATRTRSSAYSTPGAESRYHNDIYGVSERITESSTHSRSSVCNDRLVSPPPVHIAPMPHREDSVQPRDREPTGSLPQSRPEEHRRQLPRPDFLIVALFALRLARRLILTLESYERRDDDLAWLESFLSQFPSDCDLARIRGDRIDEYCSIYPAVIQRFVKQPKYPMKFMQMNPDRMITHRALSNGEFS